LNEHILTAIDEELARLRQARSLLAEGTIATAKKGRVKSTAVASSQAPKRQLSPEARQAIAEAQRRRWAKVSQRKAATTGKKAVVAS
jgi:hypothetical protein